MPATLIALADAVVAALNAQTTFPTPFTAERTYRTFFLLEELSDLKVTVAPVSVDSEALDRSEWSHANEIAVGFHKLARTTAERDALMELVEAVGDWLRNNRLPAFPQARAVSVQQDPVFDPDRLEDEQAFVSVLNVTYRVWR